MAEFVSVGSTGELSPGTMKKVVVKGEEILLARVGENIYAIAAHCSHMNGDLTRGKLEGKIVTCPRHGSQFDVTSGQNVRWMKGSGLVSAIGKAIKSPRPIRSYNVRVEGDSILIEV
jgi:3-phenylpropionate/trans-cinnamate dioxygenase ferredoxin subunit